MAKKILGIDIGADRMKIALISGNKIKKTAIADVPENIIKNGQIVSIETMAEVIKETLVKNKMHASEAALVIDNESVYVRNVTMPQMSHEQLLYNLQYEFRDYITSEGKDYIFDYAMISTKEEMEAARNKPEEEKEQDAFSSVSEYDEYTGASMELTAVVAPKELLNEMNLMLRKAGLKLTKAAPPVSAYASIIRLNRSKNEELAKIDEFCILDMGYRTIRMYMYKGDNHNVTRILEIGLSGLDMAIAEKYNVDIHLAHTYLLTNHEDCQNSFECLNAYDNIAVEIMRVLNFYRFSNPDSKLEDIWICGGGGSIEPLREAIKNTIDLNLHPGTELLKCMDAPPETFYMVLASGIAID